MNKNQSLRIRGILLGTALGMNVMALMLGSDFSVIHGGILILNCVTLTAYLTEKA